MKRGTHFFDLYWEDILVAKLLPYLTINDCFNFRITSKTCYKIANMYIARLKTLELMNRRFSPLTFNVFGTTCTQLKLINLSKCTIRDSDVIPLFSNNPLLIHLNLSNCPNLTAKCLQPVILLCPELKVFKMARCSWLTTGAIEALALHQNNLETADLSFCASLSENCILILIKKFRRLKTLNLEGNKQVTDKCLFAIAKFSTGIRFLNLGGCRDITDKGMKALAQSCRSLEGLLLRGCFNITENSLQLMRDRVMMDRRRPATEPAFDVYLPI